MTKRSWSEMTPQQRSMAVTGTVIQLVLQAAALRDLRRRSPAEVRGPRWAWAGATFINIVGPIAYFAVGRRQTVTVE